MVAIVGLLAVAWIVEGGRRAERRVPLRAAVVGRDLAPGEAAVDTAAQRGAQFARLGAALVALALVLGVGLSRGPRPTRLACGNLLVLLVLVLGLEVASRLAGVHFPSVARRPAAERQLWAYDATKGWFHVPGGVGEGFLGGPDRGIVQINSLGLRGPELPRAKPDGVKRVLVLGDSFVFGVGVDEPNVFTSRLAMALDAGDPRHRHEVVNMGVAGYSTDQELILFDELGPRLAPDVVVLVVCDNDFQGNTEDFAYRRYFKPYFELDPKGGLTRHNEPVPHLSRAQSVKLFLGQESNVWNLFRSRESRWAPAARLVSWFQVGVPRRTATDPVDLTAALVLELAAHVRAAGARFVVTNTGHRGEKTPLQQALRARLRRPDIGLLGLEESLGDARREAPERLWDFGRDTHWNRDAHRLAAEVIANYLLTKHLLEGEPSHP
jgi:hypothetical protein